MRVAAYEARRTVDWVENPYSFTRSERAKFLAEEGVVRTGACEAFAQQSFNRSIGVRDRTAIGLHDCVRTCLKVRESQFGRAVGSLDAIRKSRWISIGATLGRAPPQTLGLEAHVCLTGTRLWLTDRRQYGRAWSDVAGLRRHARRRAMGCFTLPSRIPREGPRCGRTSCGGCA